MINNNKLIRTDKEAIDFVLDLFHLPPFTKFVSLVTPQEVSEAFTTLQQMGKEWRKYFAHKGVYKTARRHFIRYAVKYYTRNPDAWNTLTEDFCLDALYKARQHWLPEWETEFFPFIHRVENFYRNGIHPRLKELGYNFVCPGRDDDYRQCL